MKFSEQRVTIFKKTIDMEIIKKYSVTTRTISPLMQGTIELTNEAKQNGITRSDLLYPAHNRKSRRESRKPFGRRGRLDGVAINHHNTPWHVEFAQREQLKKLVADNDSLLALGADHGL